MHDSALLAALRDFERRHGLDLPGKEILAAQVRVDRLADRQSAFHAGDRCARVFIVRAGLLKQSYFKHDGSEWIKSFAGPGDLFACPFALAAGGAATFASIAIGASEVESVDFGALEALAAAHAAWQFALRAGFQKLAELKVRRERDLLMLSPAELYAQLCAEAPALAVRVPQKDLAAYLGVTPVGLNRIVRRARESQNVMTKRAPPPTDFA